MSTAKRKCRLHKEYYPVSDGIVIKNGFYCSMESAVAYAKANAPRGRKKLESAERKKNARQRKEFYDKDIKTRREAAVYWFNRFIRLRDAGSGCISCGANGSHNQFHAGHFVPAGSCSALRFDESNCHLQCARCNTFLSGNLAEYRIALIDRIGSSDLLRLEGPQPTIKITVEWYKQIEDTYKAKCKELESQSLERLAL